MKEIQIKSEKYGDKVVLVDDEDYQFLNQCKWWLKPGKNTFYAARNQYPGHCKIIHLKMHRVILGITDPLINVDHIDGNGLNNQRNNLRIATVSQNLYNQIGHRDGTSKFKGVSWDSERNKWVARIKKDGVVKQIGRFEEEIDAAIAYNLYALKLHGEFARLNVLPS